MRVVHTVESHAIRVDPEDCSAHTGHWHQALHGVRDVSEAEEGVLGLHGFFGLFLQFSSTETAASVRVGFGERRVRTMKISY